MIFKNEEINNLLEQLSSVNESITQNDSENSTMVDCEKIMLKYGFPKKELENLLKHITIEKDVLESKKEDLNSRIENIRTKCDHDYILEYWDSHHDHYICTKCGKKTRD